MLPKNNRLKKTKEIEAVAKNGKKSFGSFLGIKYLKNDLAHNRFAIIVSKKVSNKAVKRNLVRRRIQAAIKIFQPTLKNNYDFLIMANPKIIVNNKIIDYKTIETSLKTLLKRADLI